MVGLVFQKKLCERCFLLLRWFFQKTRKEDDELDNGYLSESA